MAADKLIPTTVAGSLPKPSWLAEPEKLWAEWRAKDEALTEAKRDAALVWLKEQEDAGIDIDQLGLICAELEEYGYVPGC